MCCLSACRSFNSGPATSWCSTYLYASSSWLAPGEAITQPSHSTPPTPRALLALLTSECRGAQMRPQIEERARVPPQVDAKTSDWRAARCAARSPPASRPKNRRIATRQPHCPRPPARRSSPSPAPFSSLEPAARIVTPPSPSVHRLCTAPGRTRRGLGVWTTSWRLHISPYRAAHA